MNAEKEQQEFRALDFDEEDILFSSLVRFHYEMEAMEDLQKLQAGEFEQAPEEAAWSQQRAEKFFRKAERMRRLREWYRVFQKISVFLVIIIVLFIVAVIKIAPVNQAVTSWLASFRP